MNAPSAIGTTSRIIGWSLSFTLAVLLPLFLLAGYGIAVNATLICPLLVSAYSGFFLGLAYSTGAAAPMRLGYLIFVYLFLGLAPIVQIAFGLFPIPGFNDYSFLIQGGVVAVVGVCAWEAAYRLGCARPARPYGLQIADRRTYWIIAFGLLAAGAFSAVVGADLFTSRQEAAEALQSVFGEGSPFGLVFAAVGQLAIAVGVLILGERARRREVDVLVFCGALAACAAVINFFSSPRFLFGAVALAFVLALGRGVGGATRMRLFVLVWLGAFLVIFPVADSFREAGVSSIQEPIALRQQLSASDYDSFQQLATGVAFVGERGPQLGNQLLGSVFYFVPRELWPAKAEGTGPLLAEFSSGPNANLSAPLWVEGYVDFGYFGVFGFLAVYGVVCAALDRRFAAQVRSGAGAWLVLVPLLSTYQILILRGSLIVVFGPLTVILMLFIVACSGKGGLSHESLGGGESKLLAS